MISLFCKDIALYRDANTRQGNIMSSASVVIVDIAPQAPYMFYCDSTLRFILPDKEYVRNNLLYYYGLLIFVNHT